MSILSEYESIRKDIGEKEFAMIERFLSLNPQYFLGDVYYNPVIRKKYEKWRCEEKHN